MDEGLIDTATDYIHFVTSFFEPISVSAVHIYHSALELSPLSSIVRRLYYHTRHTPLPRVVSGTPDRWDQIVHLPSDFYDESYTWSPCGRFVAVISDHRVQIRDALSSELVSTIAEGIGYDCRLAYSPDGRFLAHLSDTLVIWDIQTGGVAKEIQYNAFSGGLMVWSLDGEAIAMTQESAVHVHDVASGATRSPGTLQSSNELRLWAHDRSFRVMATGLDGEVFTMEIFDVGSSLTRVESFQIKVQDRDPRIESFSPTTYRISIFARDRFRVLDVRNSGCLLEEEAFEGFHTFSSDGSLFAASLPGVVRIWRYTSGHYAPWREFVQRSWLSTPSPLHFSPTPSSILTRSWETVQVHRLDGHPVVTSSALLAILSPCGAYSATARRSGHLITITDLLSQTTSQNIHTDMEIYDLALTGTVLLVFDSGVRVAAWRLTERGLLDGVLGDRRADDCDSIWVAWAGAAITIFAVNNQAVVIEERGHIHAYHTGTGEALDPAQVHPRDARYSSTDMSIGRHYSHYRQVGKQVRSPEDDWPVPLVAPRVEWVKDPEGKHRLWIPVEWRAYNAGWLYDIKALWLYHGDQPVIIIKL